MESFLSVIVYSIKYEEAMSICEHLGRCVKADPMFPQVLPVLAIIPLVAHFVYTKCIALTPGATDRHAIKLDRRHAHPYRHALSVLAAGADAFVESEIVADH
jgi:hypothetical protein